MSFTVIKDSYPNIVKDGLVLNVDAGSRLSYSGSGTTWTDVSGSGNNGTLTNGPTYSSANSGSLVFDGTNDYVNLGNSSSYSLSGQSFTIECWIRPTAYASGAGGQEGRTVIGQWTFSGGVQGWRIDINTTNINWYTTGTIHSTSISLNEWTHIIVTGNGTTTSFYKNGTLVSGPTADTLTNVTNSKSLLIGALLHDVYSYYYQGNISNARIYNRALSAAEILQNYNALLPRYSIITRGLVLNLDAGNTASYVGSGTTWTDISGSGNNATLVSSPAYDSANGGSIVFNGTTNYATVPIVSPGTSAVTFEFWINSTTNNPNGIFDSAPGQQNVLRNFAYFSGPGYLAWWDDNPIISMGVVANTWYQIVGIYRLSPNRVIDLYRNGVYIASASSGTTSGYAWSGFRLGHINGSFSSTYAYSGKLAKFAIYNRALSAEEVSQNFTALRGRYGI